MRYGFALEHNKYDHLFLRIDCTELVKQCKPMRRVISDKDIAVNKYCRFKVKRTKICLELLAYIRAELWTYGNSIEQIFYPNDP